MSLPKLSINTKNILLCCAAEGLKIPTAAQRVGVDASTLRGWLASPEHEEFATKYREAEAEYKQKLMQNANAQAMDGHWGALQYLLDSAGMGKAAGEILNEYKVGVIEVLTETLADYPHLLRDIATQFQKRGL